MIEEKDELPNSRLLELRKEHGFNSPIGHRCSNVLEMRLANVSQEKIDKQLDEIARSINGGRAITCRGTLSVPAGGSSDHYRALKQQAPFGGQTEDDGQWPILFPEAFDGSTIDGELSRPMLAHPRSP